MSDSNQASLVESLCFKARRQENHKEESRELEMMAVLQIKLKKSLAVILFSHDHSHESLQEMINSFWVRDVICRRKKPPDFLLNIILQHFYRSSHCIFFYLLFLFPFLKFT